MAQRMSRSAVLILVAGFALVLVGIVCLYLSDGHVHGWWQGTLEAFGVGFVVGGLVDVLAISGLTQVLAVEQARRESYREALAIIDSSMDLAAKAGAAERLLARYRGRIYPDALAPLQAIVDQEKHRSAVAAAIAAEAPYPGDGT
jgi:multidrug efflux pump subunit AcrA (membrane-fusion protein)